MSASSGTFGVPCQPSATITESTHRLEDVVAGGHREKGWRGQPPGAVWFGLEQARLGRSPAFFPHFLSLTPEWRLDWHLFSLLIKT